MIETQQPLWDDEGQCKYCHFFDYEIDAQFGFCRRYAPRPVTHDYRKYESMCIYSPAMWPAVKPYDFCGEFKLAYSKSK